MLVIAVLISDTLKQHVCHDEWETLHTIIYIVSILIKFWYEYVPIDIKSWIDL